MPSSATKQHVYTSLQPMGNRTVSKFHLLGLQRSNNEMLCNLYYSFETFIRRQSLPDFVVLLGGCFQVYVPSRLLSNLRKYREIAYRFLGKVLAQPLTAIANVRPARHHISGRNDRYSPSLFVKCARRCLRSSLSYAKSKLRLPLLPKLYHGSNAVERSPPMSTLQHLALEMLADRKSDLEQRGCSQ